MLPAGALLGEAGGVAAHGEAGCFCGWRSPL